MPIIVITLFALSLFNSKEMNLVSDKQPISKFAALQFHEIVFAEEEPGNYLGKRVLFDTTLIGTTQKNHCKYLNAIINNRKGVISYLRIKSNDKLEKYLNLAHTNHIYFVINVNRYDRIESVAEFEEINSKGNLINLGETILYHGEVIYYREADVFAVTKS
ncbi:hypothetical protein [Melioribacter sp. OK-6-Me]|uniref:hypothetical protein n=1 Tax=unclassified Melioribacter TaxID=2627329 RepID=UPI003EDB4835